MAQAFYPNYRLTGSLARWKNSRERSEPSQPPLWTIPHWLWRHTLWKQQSLAGFAGRMPVIW